MTHPHSPSCPLLPVLFSPSFSAICLNSRPNSADAARPGGKTGRNDDGDVADDVVVVDDHSLALPLSLTAQRNWNFCYEEDEEIAVTSPDGRKRSEPMRMASPSSTYTHCLEQCGVSI